MVEEVLDFYSSNKNIYYCFVNDGSDDSTFDILESLRKGREKRIQILHLANNQGKAEAVRKGFIHALQWDDFDLIGYLDADFSAPLESIKSLAKEFGINSAIQMASGARIARMGANIKRKMSRHYIGRVFATFASIILKIPVYDTQCGAKLLRSDLASKIMKEPFLSPWLFDVEIFARIISRYGHKKIDNILVEVPLKQWIVKDGSKIKYSYFLKAPFELYKIHLNYKHKVGPQENRLNY